MIFSRIIVYFLQKKMDLKQFSKEYTLLDVFSQTVHPDMSINLRLGHTSIVLMCPCLGCIHDAVSQADHVAMWLIVPGPLSPSMPESALQLVSGFSSALLVVSPSLSSWNLWFGAGLWWCAILQPSHRCNHRKVRQLPGTKQITYALASTLAGCTHARNDVTSWWGNGRITVMIQPWCNRYLLPYHFISGFQHFSNIQLKPHGFGKSNLAI